MRKERGMKNRGRINLKKLIRGDRRTWDEFVDRYSPVIYSAVWKIFRTHCPQVNEYDVEDAVQEVFIRLVRRDYRLLKSYDPSRSSPVTWLTIVTRSTALDCLRRRKPGSVSLDNLAREIGEPPRAGSAKAADIIPPGLLSPRQKLVLQLIFDQGMNAAEIAEMLGVDPQTVRSTLHKAIAKLRKLFQKS